MERVWGFVALSPEGTAEQTWPSLSRSVVSAVPSGLLIPKLICQDCRPIGATRGVTTLRDDKGQQ